MGHHINICSALAYTLPACGRFVSYCGRIIGTHKTQGVKDNACGKCIVFSLFFTIWCIYNIQCFNIMLDRLKIMIILQKQVDCWFCAYIWSENQFRENPGVLTNNLLPVPPDNLRTFLGPVYVKSFANKFITTILTILVCYSLIKALKWPIKIT